MKTRKILAISSLLLLTGCVNHIDLTQPVYLLINDSVSKDCPIEGVGCLEQRLKDIYQGLSYWFDYLPVDERPAVYFIRDNENTPDSNTIEIKVYPIDSTQVAGRYSYRSWKHPIIMFTRSAYVNNGLDTWTIAHEFGHALEQGSNEDHIDINDRYSVMNCPPSTDPTPSDFRIMCQDHWELKSCREIASFLPERE